jgi:hypothetical protein
LNLGTKFRRSGLKPSVTLPVLFLRLVVAL